MDVNKALGELHEEKRRLDLIIAALEARLGIGSRAHKRRGRKSMSPEERLEVSKRMSQYWEARRIAATESEPQPKSVAAAAAGNSSSVSA